MTMEIFQEIWELGQKVKDNRKSETTDYHRMTAPCGLPCFECPPYLAQFDDQLAEKIAGVFNLDPEQIKCKGCRDENGAPAHLPMECRVYKCTHEAGMTTCAECDNFPCENLHPYRDQAEKWHNTKVYHLCLIKKLGLEKWAEEEAGGILEKYFYGTWTL